MAENKTQKSSASVKAFLDEIEDETVRADCNAIAKMMQKATGAKPAMWGPSIVGFGDYHYVYESGREGDWFLAGFSPRKGTITLYVMSGFTGHVALMKKLGKFKTGKSCLYVKSLADVDVTVLQALIDASVAHMKMKR